MGALMRGHDWPGTALGAVSGWPESLRSTLGLCLDSAFPIAIYWGPQLALLYNDAWRPILGDKHPWALGRPAREVWPEIWDAIDPVFQRVFATGRGVFNGDSLLAMKRFGYVEECYFDYTFNPIRAGAAVGGIFNVVIETTYRVIGARRAKMQRDFAARLATAKSAAQVIELAFDKLAESAYDVPFALLYRAVPGGGEAALARAVGIEAGSAVVPHRIALRGGGTWPLAQAAATGHAVVVGRLEETVGPLPGGPWPEAAREAVVLPVLPPGETTPAFFMVAGVNPRRALDAEYAAFFDSLAGHLASALASAEAFESERRRAEALAELDRAKTVFFSNVSHELRTPLTLMLGPLQDALDSPGRALRGRDLDAAHRNALRLLRLVNALLDFSRIEAGRIQALYRPTDLAARTADLASQFRSAVERGGLRLLVRCAPLAEPVYVDADMWEKIVLNLLSNAFKFTHQGEIEVALERSGDEVLLRVRDTGIGVVPGELPRLFERFYRVEGARGRSHEGSGIGLALVQELVRLHGGRIEASSEPGRGTEFRVFLRPGRGHLPAEKVREEAAEPAGASRSLFLEEALSWTGGEGVPQTDPVVEEEADRGARIVLAEDNADMRDYLRRLLGAQWSVEPVPDGRAALEAIRRDAPALVITDVMMPGLDGFGLVKALREAPDTRGIPVIMLSARAGEEARIEGLEAGADDYIVKPFSARELVARVGANLKLSRLRQQLKTEQAAMAALFQQTPLPIAVLRGPRLVFELANPPCQAVAGNRPLLGRPLLEALPELADQRLDELLLRVMRSGEPYVGREAKVRLERGGRLEDTYWTFIYAALRGIGGGNDGVVVIASEVTDQVMARERQERLIHEAAQAGRAKDEFLAMLGHELRNPLAPIATALQLLRLRRERLREYDIIERQFGHLKRLVDDLLDVSRITQGKIELRRSRVEMSDIVARAVETASPLLEQRRNRVEIRVPREGLEVDADPDRMAQVVANLLTNASKYSDEDSRIELYGRRDGDRVRVQVKDYGSGIAPEMLERIWDIFVQQPQTMERSVGGLGLGLTIVRSLVRLHHGEVLAASEGLGRGAQFTVELPAAVAGAARDPAPPARQRAPAAPLRVLVVDDNVDAASTLAMMLSQLGHTVGVAHDGPGALDAAERLDPQLALVDIGLPVIDGYELARRLRDARGSALKLIAVTGYGQASDLARSAAAGFSGHLVKPIDLPVLLDAMSEACPP